MKSASAKQWARTPATLSGCCCGSSPSRCLWANLIAWPVAGYLMNRWLHGFAYHTDLQPWLFLSATAAAIAIALITVSTHSIRVARAKPIAALRYE